MLGEQARLAVRWRDSRRRKSSCALNVSLLHINNLGFPVLKNLRLSWECHWCYLKIKMNYLYFCNFRKCPTTRSQWPGWAEQSEELQARAVSHRRCRGPVTCCLQTVQKWEARIGNRARTWTKRVTLPVQGTHYQATHPRWLLKVI